MISFYSLVVDGLEVWLLHVMCGYANGEFDMVLPIFMIRNWQPRKVSLIITKGFGRLQIVNCVRVNEAGQVVLLQTVNMRSTCWSR